METAKIERTAGIGLIVLGALLFLYFGLVKGAATDVGVYAITVVPLVLGFGALWRSGRHQAS